MLLLFAADGRQGENNVQGDCGIVELWNYSKRCVARVCVFRCLGIGYTNIRIPVPSTITRKASLPM